MAKRREELLFQIFERILQTLEEEEEEYEEEDPIREMDDFLNEREAFRRDSRYSYDHS